LNSNSVVVIPKGMVQTIYQWAEKAYPNEGCGLLVGQFEEKNKKKVVRLATLTNQLLTKNINNAPTLPTERQGQGAGKTEFVMDPQEFNKEMLKAEQDGLDVVGIIHTHPDHPALPSRIDASQPFLAQWSNIIVAVHQGKTKEMKSWFREEDGQEFTEEQIVIRNDVG